MSGNCRGDHGRQGRDLKGGGERVMERVWQESRRENDLGDVREDSRGREKLKQYNDRCL